MKKYVTTLISVFLLLIPQMGMATWGLKIGSNYSFLKEPSYGKPGVDVMYGISKDWSINRWIHLQTELLISHSGTLLKDRSVQSGCDNSEVFRSFPYLPDETTGYTDISYFDMDIQLKYLEIPILLKVEKLVQKNLSVGLEIGFSLKFTLKDGSRTTFLREVKSVDWTEAERLKFRFDYRTTKNNENYSYNGQGVCPNFGAFVNYSKFRLGARYQIDYVDWVSSIVIGEGVPFHVINFSIAYLF